MLDAIDEILAFWFPEEDTDEGAARRWFTRDDAFDESIRTRFGALVEQALAGELGGEWAATPRGRLAHVLLLDQFTRNLFRGSPRAFAGDARARALTLDGIERGDDLALPLPQRVFFYLPLEHAEDLSLQERSVALFERLAQKAPAAARARYDNYADYARRHRDAIAQFGRFPHRNAVLGRATTPDEQAYLDGGGGF